jgi:polysaccharide export outer membrane protein
MMYRTVVALFLIPAAIRCQGPAPQPHPLGPDDMISLSVYGSPELTRNFRIGGDGQLTLPMVLLPITAKGLLPSQLESNIVKALRENRVLVNPLVSVTVVEYSSRPITVLGAVHRPVTFQATGTLTLLDALARAEGLNPEAGPEILLTRAGDAAEPIRIPVHKLMYEGSPELNYRLQGGEQIRVPEAAKVFIIGNVKRPGAFPLRDPADATVMKFLAQAEGLTPFSQSEAIVYRMNRQTGERTEIAVPLKKIMDRKTPDVHLQADDLLYVPEAKGKRLTATAIDRVIGFGSSAASVLVWRF